MVDLDTWFLAYATNTSITKKDFALDVFWNRRSALGSHRLSVIVMEDGA